MTSRMVMLRLAPDLLKDFDFPDPPPRKKRVVRRKPAAPRTRARPKTEGVVNGVDPILGSLPRTVKAAPTANMSGLILDKTPARKWEVRPVPLKSFTGVAYEVASWCSEMTPEECANGKATASSGNAVKDEVTEAAEPTKERNN